MAQPEYNDEEKDIAQEWATRGAEKECAERIARYRIKLLQESASWRRVCERLEGVNIVLNEALEKAYQYFEESGESAGTIGIIRKIESAMEANKLAQSSKPWEK